MRAASVFARLLGLEQATVWGVEFDQDEQVLVVHARPHAGQRSRCGVCRHRCPGYDKGEGRRRWRALDLGTIRAYVEADAPRVRCPGHGVVVAAVPWARHGAGHTLEFDQMVAWLAVHASKTAVCEQMRIAWRTVGKILTRVVQDLTGGADPLDGLRRIGIDEVSFKKHHHYLTVVIDHDRRRLVWAAEGKDRATLNAFFDQLGPERAVQLEQVSADMADWIGPVVRKRASKAVVCADPFHVVAWAMKALDEERRRAWNQARGAVNARKAPIAEGKAKALKKARWPLWKNPENLTEEQQEQLKWIAKTDPRLHRAYLLKEGLRHVFALKGEEGKDALDKWIKWAQHCRIPVFVDLSRTIRRHRPAIDATLELGLSNALIESTNTKIRLLTRVAYGFHSSAALIALATLALGDHRPTLPGRNQRKNTHG
ncbi:MAG: ISL3 family transposase [Motilibacteraceae bacterium]